MGLERGSHLQLFERQMITLFVRWEIADQVFQDSILEDEVPVGLVEKKVGLIVDRIHSKVGVEDHMERS